MFTITQKTALRRFNVVSAPVLAAALAAIALLPALADKPAPPPSAPKPEPAKTSDDKSFHDKGLQPEPISVESLGLTMNLPIGAVGVVEKINDDASLSNPGTKIKVRLALNVTDNTTTPTWTLRIQAMDSSLEKPTPAAQIDDLLKELDKQKQKYKVLDNKPMACNGRAGQLCYLERPGLNDQPYVTGWLILPVAQRTFMVFSLQTLPEHLKRIRPSLEAAYGTVVLRDSDEIAVERAAKLETGKQMLASLTPQKLKALVGQSQWLRVYSPPAKPGGLADERGYFYVEAVEGHNGELDPAKPEKNYTPSEKRLGLLVRVKGRAVVDEAKQAFLDIVCLYWMAWDQKEEAWNVMMTAREGQAPRTIRETGVRSSTSPGAPPKLTVVSADSVSNSREPMEWLLPDVYMSQGLRWVLGSVLPRDAKGPIEFNSYFYDNSSDKAQLVLRSDVWEPVREGNGAFRLTTKMTSDGRPAISTFDKDGALLQRLQIDGAINEPTTMEDLRRVWKLRGLPLGKIGK